MLTVFIYTQVDNSCTVLPYKIALLTSILNITHENIIEFSASPFIIGNIGYVQLALQTTGKFL